MTSSPVPSKDKKRLQVYVPQDVIDLINDAEDVIAATRSKIVEYAVRKSLGAGSVCVELTNEEMEALKRLSIKHRRQPSEQAAVFIAEGLQREESN